MNFYLKWVDFEYFNFKIGRTMYVMPLSVPASHGYRSISIESFQPQSCVHKFKPLTPTTQSGDGPNIDTTDSLWWMRSVRKLADVFVLTFGYHRPAALISVRRRGPFARSSNSIWRTEPNSAICLKPSVARWFSPQNEKFESCDAPITSAKWVSQTANGKSRGCVSFDQIPSNVNWLRRKCWWKHFNLVW